MARNPLTQIFDSLLNVPGNISLARRGAMLFLLPAFALTALLVGLVIIQIETADYYPRRAEQDREVSDATIKFALDNAATIRSVKDFLQTRNLSPECQIHLQALQADESKLRDIRANFGAKRAHMLLFFLRSPKEATGFKNLAEAYVAIYRRPVAAAEAAVLAAGKANDADKEYRLLTLPETDTRRDEVPPSQFQDAQKKAVTAIHAAHQAYSAARLQQLNFVRVPDSQPFGPDASARERYLWFTLLLAYSLVAMALLALGGFLFVRSLLTRLKILSENGKRLALRQPLHERLPGSDEITALDRAFHDMSDVIENSTRVHKLMMENATDLICSLDRSGRLESVSDAVKDILGYSPDDMLGVRLVDYIAENSRERFVETFKSVVATRSQASFEMPVSKRGGEEVELLWSAIWSAADNSVLCVTHDITETKRAERVQQELVQMVSHDLRSPLVAISGFHEFAERGLMGTFDENGMKQIYSARRSTQQMLTLVNDLLEVERMESGMLELSETKIPLQKLFDAALQSVGIQAQAKNITVSIESSVPFVRGDEHRLAQVMMNLLTNAIKFSYQGGKIVVRAEQLSDAVKISVSDYGDGLSEENKKSIFERFRQIRSADKTRLTGTGLGLSICKALVTLHGGEIWVESTATPGKGSTFIFTIPNAVAAIPNRNRSTPDRKMREIRDSHGT